MNETGKLELSGENEKVKFLSMDCIMKGYYLFFFPYYLFYF